MAPTDTPTPRPAASSSTAAFPRPTLRPPCCTKQPTSSYMPKTPQPSTTAPGIKETEAESVAYVVAGLLGLDTTPSSISYVTGWTHGDTDMIKNTAARVLNAVRTLTDALTSEEAAHVAA